MKTLSDQFRVGFLGPPDTGKSSLCRALLGLEADATEKADLFGIYEKDIAVEHRSTSFKLTLLDIAGQVDYRSLAYGHTEDAHVLLILVDITKTRSWKKDTKDFLQLISDQDKAHKRKPRPIYVVCSKIDTHTDEHLDEMNRLERTVRKHKLTLLQVSAFDGTGIEDLKSVLYAREQQIFDRNHAPRRCVLL